jgi:hypothetical protein
VAIIKNLETRKKFIYLDPPLFVIAFVGHGKPANQIQFLTSPNSIHPELKQSGSNGKHLGT